MLQQGGDKVGKIISGCGQRSTPAENY